MLAAHHYQLLGVCLADRRQQVADEQPLIGEHAADADHMGIGIDALHDFVDREAVDQQAVVASRATVALQGLANAVHKGHMMAGPF